MNAAHRPLDESNITAGKRSRWIRVLVAAALSLSAALAYAEDVLDKQQYFAIPAQALDTALLEFSKQARVQVLADAEALRGYKTLGVSGTEPARMVLTKLLADSDLTFIVIGKAVQVRPHARTLQREGEGAEPQVMLARLNQPAANSGGEGAQVPVAREADESVGRPQESLSEIVVTGSRLRQLDEGPSPVVVIDRERIEQLGVTQLADVFHHLPQNPFDDQPQALDGRREIQLRGLGLGTTLVLINGRRTVASAQTAAGNTFDLNTISLAAVERIEILSDSSSAIYGGDAVGGVVNIITRKLQQPSVGLYYGTPQGGGRERRATMATGYTGSRMHASVMLDLSDSEFLFGAERDRLADQDYRRFGSLDRRATLANPGNIVSTSAGNLPGMSSRTAVVPAGSTGVGLTPADFTATAGQTNYTSNGAFRSLVPQARSLSGSATLDLALTDSLNAFAEFQYSHRNAASTNTPVTTIARVPASNAFNPFGAPVDVRYRFVDIEPSQFRHKASSYRGAVGLKGALRSWDWELTASGSHEDVEQGPTLGSPLFDRDRFNAALASSNPQQALNLFADGPAGSPVLVRSLLTARPAAVEHSSKSVMGSAFIRGSVGTLPAGEAQLVLGAEVGNEDIHYTDAVTRAALLADRTRSAVFSEMHIPIVSQAMGVALVDQLVFTVAGRYDHYDDFGGDFNPKFGLQWNPVPSLQLRGSYGTGFRPPSLYQLYLPSGFRTVGLFDPSRGETVSADLISGGNLDLAPEDIESLTYGLVWTPPVWNRQLHITASRWAITQDDQIGNLGDQVILAYEALFPENVVRAAPDPSDPPAMPGRLLAVRTSPVNFGRTRVGGTDVQVTTTLPVAHGRLTLDLASTWYDEFRVANVPGEAPKDQVGVARSAPFGTIPRWKAAASVAWSQPGLTASITARHTPAYKDATVARGPNGRSISARTITDLQISGQLDDLLGGRLAFVEGLTVRVGVRNLFDEMPDFAEIVQTLGYDPSQGSLIGRYPYMQVSKAFQSND